MPTRATTVAPCRSLSFFARVGIRRPIYRKDDNMTANTPIKGILISAGNAYDITLHSEDRVKAIAEAVGCEVFTVVGLAEGIDLFVDDEGLINGSPLNMALTVLTHKLGNNEVLFGNGLVVSVDDEGETVSLTERQREVVVEALSSKPDSETVDRLCESLSPLPGILAMLRP